VLALGAQVNFFGVNQAADHAFPLYTLADAVRLKEHILEAVIDWTWSSMTHERHARITVRLTRNNCRRGRSVTKP